MSSQIGDELADHDVIGSALAFRICTPRSHGAGPFQAGTYELRKDMGVERRGRRRSRRPATLDYVKLALIPGL